MLLVKEFVEKQKDNFPDMFYASLPITCPDCGSFFEMSETLTKLSCANLRCPSKIVQRLDAMTKALGIKDFGEARITSFVRRWKCTSPMSIFAFSKLYPDRQLSDDIKLETSKKIMQQFDAKRSMTLSEYVRLNNIPFVQNSAVLLFGEYDDINKAYDDILEGGTEFIRQKLGLSEISTRVLFIYDSLLKFKDDLVDCVEFVDIRPVNTSTQISLKAVVSDEVGAGFKTKAEFYAACNAISPNIHIEFLTSVNKTINYLIWAGADGDNARYTSKVQKVEKYNMDYLGKEAANILKPGDHYIPILTAPKFIEELKAKAKKQGGTSK